MLHGLKGRSIDIEAFVKDMRCMGFEFTYVRAIIRKNGQGITKFIDFESTFAMNAFIDFLQAGGLVMGRRVSPSKIKLSHTTVGEVSLKDPQNAHKLGKNVWFNPQFYPMA
jgi:hypothetical protein